MNEQENKSLVKQFLKPILAELVFD